MLSNPQQSRNLPLHTHTTARNMVTDKGGKKQKNSKG